MTGNGNTGVAPCPGMTLDRWPETNVAHTDRPTLIRHLLEGQYSSPVCVVAFNTAEDRSRDVTDHIAATLAQACADRGEITSSIADFIADHPSE